MQKDAFKPQGREISVVGMGGPMPMPGQQNRMMAVAPVGPAARQPVQAQGPLAVAPSARGAAIGGQKEVPRGAQQVRMAAAAPPPPLDGTPVDRGASFQPSQVALAPAPAPGPEMGDPAPQAPRPFLQRTSNGQSVFRVTMRCRMGDGSEYMSMHDAEFPAGAQPVHLDFAPLT